jgi:N-acetylglucosamine kinase-like BadF-type ATPase
MSALWIGVDGGGTRTTCVALDAQGGFIARRTGGASLVRAGREAASVTPLVELIRETAAHGSEPLPVRGVCCALAGAGRSAERDAVLAALVDARVAEHVLVVTDAEAALHDAFGESAGILLISGTGSIAWARSVDGETRRVGGWGERLGDEGSGFDIGSAALRAVARAHDGRAQPTALTDIVLRHTGVAEPSALIAWVAAATKASIAAVAPAVVDCAAHDAAAAAIVDHAVASLLQHLEAARRLLEPWPTPPKIALAGGMLMPAAPLRGRLEHALRAAHPDARVVARAIDAAAGAAALARRAAGSQLPRP